MNKLVSIITVSFNSKPNIERTIQSIINQTLSEKEYIIIDGGSTDGTIEIIKRYQDKITKWVSERDKGIYDAMNKGIDLAEGKWIIFINSGDTFASNNTLKEIKKHLLNDNIDFLYGNTIVKYKEYENTPLLIKADPRPERFSFYHQSVFVKTSILKKERFKIDLLAAEYEIYNRLLYKGYKFSYINLPISIYESGGISDKKQIKHFIECFKISYLYSPNTFYKIKNILRFSIKFIYLISKNITKKILPQKILLFMTKIKYFILNKIR